MPAIQRPAGARELRRAVAPIRGLQLRQGEQTGDGSLTMQGHAAVFSQETVMFDVGWWRLREVIAPGAFSEVLGRDPLVHLVHQHDMSTAMAATDVEGIGGLDLSEDEEGLRFFARVDPQDRDVQALEVKMRRGYVRQASFAFTIAAATSEIEVDEDGNEDELLRITEIGELFDVSVVAQGAYPTTDATLRSQILAALNIGRPPEAGADTSVAPAGPAGADTVAPPAGGDQREVARRLAALRATTRLRIATLDL